MLAGVLVVGPATATSPSAAGFAAVAAPPAAAPGDAPPSSDLAGDRVAVDATSAPDAGATAGSASEAGPSEGAASEPTEATAPDAAAPVADPVSVAELFTPFTILVLVLAAIAAGVVAWRRWDRVPGPPARAVAIPLEIALVCTAGMLVAGFLAAGTAQRLFPNLAGGGDEPSLMSTVVVLGAATAGQMAVAGFWFAMGRPGGSWHRPFRARLGPERLALGGPRRPAAPTTPTAGDDRPRPSLGPAVLVGLLGIAAAWPLSIGVGALVNIARVAFGGPPPDPIAHETLQTMVEAPRDATFLAMIVLVVLAIPLVEEILYRGMVQGVVRSMGFGPRTAVVGTSVVFAAMHLPVVDLHAAVSLFVLSLGFGLVVERTGRLTPAIVMHAIFNGGNLLLATLHVGSSAGG